MNRYLIGTAVAAIALLALVGLGNGREVLQRAGEGARESVSANPSTAAEGTGNAGIESAGENVLRQTSPEAIERSQNLNGATPTTNTGSTPQTQPSSNATPPVPPSTTPPATPQPAPAQPNDQEPIPALW